MVLTLKFKCLNDTILFENDVNQYGSYTANVVSKVVAKFENDVNQYGSYTRKLKTNSDKRFENDVNQYGSYTRIIAS